MYVYDRQTYLKRIKNLTGFDAEESASDLDNGQLFDLWVWIKEESKSDERDGRVSMEEVTDKIMEISHGCDPLPQE